MDNRYFKILGHATGRLLLKRPGYELDIERLVDHAKQVGCFFEINSNPNRLDLLRRSRAAGERARREDRDQHRCTTSPNSISWPAASIRPAARGWNPPTCRACTLACMLDARTLIGRHSGLPTRDTCVDFGNEVHPRKIVSPVDGSVVAVRPMPPRPKSTRPYATRIVRDEMEHDVAH